MQPRQREEEIWEEQIKKERQFEELERLFAKTKRAQEHVLHLFQDAWQGNRSQQRLGLIEETMTEEWQKRKKQMYAVDDTLKESRRAHQRAQFASRGAKTHAKD
ncbi:hypothetical protein PWEIH_09226 [Listeria weihenstephanensis FSL R9-0317]|uniref:Uncharacterized protein n=1 Tax=Listeria weihenstephanensis TaxID=1006155 RepID=A0A1S7FXZ5_9LIST|nr:hypothetical protein [Listeria weihenstephanensis]AQY52272.1 hypothetical protein UE46_15425 [Listeria weihenstephanensis]EUJ38637.1 hypothetical protein PWEIH_09226 [Listeria weihenstephanensis FSL R9-0317]MBC1502169.1 hypothetical protein [Listeria weihenstephanensis]